jgi:hypothetical protein
LSEFVEVCDFRLPRLRESKEKRKIVAPIIRCHRQEYRS